MDSAKPYIESLSHNTDSNLTDAQINSSLLLHDVKGFEIICIDGTNTDFLKKILCRNLNHFKRTIRSVEKCTVSKFIKKLSVRKILWK